MATATPSGRARAENLERLGLHVFLDKWELVAGDLIAVRLQKGLAAADAVVFVVSAESVGRGWVDEELAAAHLIDGALNP